MNEEGKPATVFPDSSQPAPPASKDIVKHKLVETRSHCSSTNKGSNSNIHFDASFLIKLKWFVYSWYTFWVAAVKLIEASLKLSAPKSFLSLKTQMYQFKTVHWWINFDWKISLGDWVCARARVCDLHARTTVGHALRISKVAPRTHSRDETKRVNTRQLNNASERSPHPPALNYVTDGGWHKLTLFGH